MNKMNSARSWVKLGSALFVTLALIWLSVFAGSNIPLGKRLIQKDGVDYSVEVQYFPGHSTTPNLTKFLAKAPNGGETKILTLLSVERVGMVLSREELLICHYGGRVYDIYSRFGLDEYRLKSVSVVVVPEKEGLRCGRGYDEEIWLEEFIDAGRNDVNLGEY